MHHTRTHAHTHTHTHTQRIASSLSHTCPSAPRCLKVAERKGESEGWRMEGNDGAVGRRSVEGQFKQAAESQKMVAVRQRWCADGGWTGSLSCGFKMGPDRVISHTRIYLDTLNAGRWEWMTFFHLTWIFIWQKQTLHAAQNDKWRSTIYFLLPSISSSFSILWLTRIIQWVCLFIDGQAGVLKKGRNAEIRANNLIPCLGHICACGFTWGF